MVYFTSLVFLFYQIFHQISCNEGFSLTKKGGKLRMGLVGTFNSKNIYDILLVPAWGLDLLYDSLMYGTGLNDLKNLVAEKMIFSEKSVKFQINKLSKFSDGTNIGSKDILNTIVFASKLPQFEIFKKISKIKINSDYEIEFFFEKINNDLIYAIATLPIMKEDLTGSGPYTISKFKNGSFINYKKDHKYWAVDLEVNKNCNNFNEITYNYYKNFAALTQAFAAQDIDIVFESDPKDWKKKYKKDKNIEFFELEHGRQVSSKVILFNLDNFKDIKIRKAITCAFDFDTINRMIFDRKMKQPVSIFSNADFSSAKLLNVELSQKDTEDSTKSNSSSNDSFKNVYDPEKAVSLFLENGYKINDSGKIIDKSNSNLRYKFLISDQRFEKIALYFKKNLEAIGIDLDITLTDKATYEFLVSQKKYDFIIYSWFVKPGYQLEYNFKKIIGSNYDFKDFNNKIYNLIKGISTAKTYQEYKKLSQKLDSYVMNEYIQIPVMYDNFDRFVYWNNKIAFPKPLKNKRVNIAREGYQATQNS